jgi:hypothetical protein
LTNPLESPPHSQIGRKKYVGITQRPHRNVRSSPWTDAAQSLQPCPSLCTIGTTIEHQVALRDCLRDSAHRVLPAPWDSKGGEIRVYKSCRLWENVRQVTVRRRQRLAEAANESTRDRASTRHRNLLAEDRAHGKLEAIDASRQPSPRKGAHDGTKDAVVGKGIVDGDWVGVEVEQLPAPPHRRTEIAYIAQPQHASNIAFAGRELDRPIRCRQSQSPPVHSPVKGLDP